MFLIRVHEPLRPNLISEVDTSFNWPCAHGGACNMQNYFSCNLLVPSFFNNIQQIRPNELGIGFLITIV